MNNGKFDPLNMEDTYGSTPSRGACGGYALFPGQSLGQYRILRPLGWGGMGNYSDRTAKGSFSKWTIIVGYDDRKNVTCEVEQSWANPWGLYGVGGNVWECTISHVGGGFDAWRGASWLDDGQGALRCSNRDDFNASYRVNDYGFRLVLSRPGQK